MASDRAMQREKRPSGPKPREEDQDLLKQGKVLANRLFTLIRTSHMHDSSHPFVSETAGNFLEVVRAVYGIEQEVNINLSHGMLRLNDVWLKTGLAGHTIFQFIIDELNQRGIGGIAFGPLLTVQELVQFIYLFNQGDLYELQRKMPQAGITNISLSEPLKGAKGDEAGRKDIRSRSIKSFSRGLHLYQQLMETVKANAPVNFKGAKRVVQSMVDIVCQDESVLMALAAFKQYDDYTFKHSMNVCVYSLAFGHQLGLDKAALAYLGMSGFFHDIGKLLVRKEVLTKPAKLSDEEWEEMKRHVVYGASYLLKSPNLDELLADGIVVAYEHHLDFNLAGYPVLRKERELDLFSRIVSIADCYDALTNARVYRPYPYSPLEALTMMVEKKGVKYDEELLRTFLRLVGVYPVGTVVRLDSGEVALVYRVSHRSESPDRPIVKIFTDAKGNWKEPELFDLRQQDPQTGSYLKSITETLDSRTYFTKYEDYLEML